ncbi:MAG: hypothetical protein Q9208_001079 [Pyrenodesmia sp. 3 TL-2023]
MGRKPNQRVLEYFDRGARLADNSNRYEHTCKACGELFPKGRIESLIAHIETKCPSIRRPNDVHVSPPASHSHHSDTGTNGTSGNTLEHLNGTISEAKELVLPLNSRTSLSGLEALVEASTQLEHPPEPSPIRQSQDQSIDPCLEQRSSRFPASNLDTSLQENVAYNVAYSAPDGDENHALSGGLMGAHYLHQSYPLTGVKWSQDPAALSMIAASATNLQATMPQATGDHQDQSTVNVMEEDSPRQYITSNVPMAPDGSIHTEDSVPDRATTQRLQPAPGPLAHLTSAISRAEDGPHHQIHGLERLHGRAQKVRGKFTDSRRQEVQNIRKKGACIRCRMLRKTLDCVRTNIYKELDIFHAGSTYDLGSSLLDLPNLGPFEALTSLLWKKWQDRRLEEAGQSSVRLSYFADLAFPVFFPAQFYQREDSDDAQSHDRGHRPDEKSAALAKEPTEQMSTKLLCHMRSGVAQSDYEEPYPFTGPTLRLVLRILNGENDKLLAQTFDLWALTQVMVSAPKDWQLVPNPSDAESTDHQPPKGTGPAGLPESEARCSLQMITAQLQAAAHQKASMISRNVMIELERRLERKERCRGFETFLVGILLLSAVDRMCWALKTASLTLQGGDWPLEKPVEHYLNQATSFTDFLSKLYRMRGILLHVRPYPDDGILHANSTIAPAAEQWLSELRLTKDVLEARQAATFDPTDYRCFDFRFCSKMFLVEG